MTGLIKEIEQRRAKRALREDKIPEDVVDRLMTAATFAPSCFNNQSWRFLVASDNDALIKVRGALSGGNYWAQKAPLYILVATRPDLGCMLSDRRDYAFLDCGLAVENLVLQAFKEGLYAHPIAGYDPVKLKEEFHIPDEFIVITIVVVGYPGDDSFLSEKHRELEHSPRDRKPAEEVISFNAWGFGSS
jgi:nitroreductase